jgi:hypothetical protein
MSKKTAKECRGRLTPRIILMPVNTIFAGENTWEADVGAKCKAGAKNVPDQYLPPVLLITCPVP